LLSLCIFISTLNIFRIKFTCDIAECRDPAELGKNPRIRGASVLKQKGRLAGMATVKPGLPAGREKVSAQCGDFDVARRLRGSWGAEKGAVV
jgi:hypothetical protein